MTGVGADVEDAEALRIAEDKGSEDMLAFATSAVRDAANGDAILAEVSDRTGQEIAGGADEEPDVAWSIPLGAARLARDHIGDGAPDPTRIRGLRKKIRADIAADAGRLLRAGPPDVAAATSKTFRSLARICGAAPSEDGPLVARTLALAGLQEWIPRLVDMDPADVASLPGVSPSRTHQILPGALVAEAVMDLFDLAELQVCPWALREGVILERLDQLPESPADKGDR